MSDVDARIAHDAVLRAARSAGLWVEDESWMRCEHPERPGDHQAFYTWDCDGCTLGLIADVTAGQRADVTSRTIEDGTVVSNGTLQDALDVCIAYRIEEQLPTFGYEIAQQLDKRKGQQ